MEGTSKNNGFRLPNQKLKGNVHKGRFTHSSEEACPGTPLYRKKLDGNIKAEANNDGTIYIDESVEVGSAKEREVLMHEMKHMTDMKVGKLAYGDNYIKWNGETFARKDGKIQFEGKWVMEGSKSFPWEQH